jgi:phosphonate transport system substrate-binding protein
LLIVCLLTPWVGLVAAPVAETATADNGQRPLQFGLLPYVSTRKLFTTYAPIKDYLQRTLGRQVVMSTAPDFKTYIARARRGDYDLYHTAPHFAALAEQAFGYRRVSRFLRELDGSIVVARDGPIHRARDLRGRTMRTPDALAIITFLGEQWLQENGLRPHVDVEVRYSPSHNNAILAVARGEAEAAVTSAAVFEKMPPEVREKLHILTSTHKVPHMMFMAGPHLSAQELSQLRQAMLAFTAQGAGKQFFARSGYGDMGVITDADMARLSPFVSELMARTQH